MARASISIVCCGLAAAASSQSVGQFGPGAYPSAPGIGIDQECFRVLDSGGDRFCFLKPLGPFKRALVSDHKALAVGEEAPDLPSKIRVNLLSPGMELYFGQGFALRLTTDLSPYLTWQEGTINAGLPTAKGRWQMVSFQTPQPPVLLVFDRPVQLQLDGKAGEWTLRTRAPYKGWVRVCLPMGQEKVDATAHALGVAVEHVDAFLPCAIGASPEVKKLDIKEEPDKVVATWRFDRPWAVVPPCLLLAKAGGYPIRFTTGVKELQADLHEGPFAFTTQAKLTIEFPIRLLPQGRAVRLDDDPPAPPASVSGFDVSSLADLSLQNLVARRYDQTIQLIHQAQDEFTASIRTQTVPSAVQAPLNQGGEGVDVMAAHALLTQSGLYGEGSESLDNKWLATLLKRRDWASGCIEAENATQARRATALASLAAALCPEGERHLSACLLEAGFAWQKAIQAYAAKRHFPAPASADSDPMGTLRRTVFMEGAAPTAPDPFFASLSSPLRVLSPVPVKATKTPDGYTLEWTQLTAKQDNLKLSSAYPIEVEAARNLARVVPAGQLGQTSLKFVPQEPGLCSVVIKFPSWAPALPKAVPPPRYSE